MNKRLTFEDKNDLGKLIITVGVIILAPLVMLIFYPEDVFQAPYFLWPGLGSIALGILVCAFANPNQGRHTWSEDVQSSSISVLFVWGFGFVASAIPFCLSGQLTFLRALFESVSGWTTTGYTLLEVGKLTHIFIFYKTWIQYVGGLGFVLMMIMLVQSKQAMSLYHAEGHTDNIAPNIKNTAKTIFAMFLGFLIVGTALYMIFGMNLFDALCHSMSAISTSGFSTQMKGIGYYDSIAIEIVTMVLMLIGTTNFAVLLLMIKGKFKKAFRVTEIRFGIALLLIVIPLVAFGLMFQAKVPFGEAVLESTFNCIATMSTTGYSTTDLSKWPESCIGFLIVLMIIGGGIGSTAGGIKLVRAHVMFKSIWYDLKKRVSSKRVIFSPCYRRAQGKVVITREILREVMAFVSMYILIFILGSLALSITANCSLSNAMFDFISALSGVGLTIGITNADSSNATLVVEMIGMILGRLEIFIVFIGVYSIFAKIKKSIGKVIKMCYNK